MTKHCFCKSKAHLSSFIYRNTYSYIHVYSKRCLGFRSFACDFECRFRNRSFIENLYAPFSGSSFVSKPNFSFLSVSGKTIAGTVFHKETFKFALGYEELLDKSLTIQLIGTIKMGKSP